MKFFNRFNQPEKPEKLSGVVPLARAFAHSDSNQKVPLTDALFNGFASIEADVWLINGELLIGHDLKDTAPGRTLEEVYLKPLQAFAKENGGTLFPKAPQTLQLLIDVKNDAEGSYAAIHKLLEKYKDILSVCANGTVKEGAVTAVISGNRARVTMAVQPVRYAFYDGRLPDLAGTPPASFMPVVSDRWGDYFKWDGIGEMPAEEREKLRQIVTLAHAGGQRLRFWATQDKSFVARKAIWKELVAAGVDYICTDHPADLKDWLQQNDPTPSSPLRPIFAGPPPSLPQATRQEREMLARSWPRRAANKVEEKFRDSRLGPYILFGVDSVRRRLGRPKL
jgi:hypothetical protein